MATLVNYEKVIDRLCEEYIGLIETSPLREVLVKELKNCLVSQAVDTITEIVTNFSETDPIMVNHGNKVGVKLGELTSDLNEVQKLLKLYQQKIEVGATPFFQKIMFEAMGLL